MSIKVRLKHVMAGIALYDKLLKIYKETNLGAKGISEQILGKDDREFGKNVQQKLLDMGIIECTGVKANHFAEGDASWGHEPGKDIHAPKTPYYKRGKNWTDI